MATSLSSASAGASAGATPPPGPMPLLDPLTARGLASQVLVTCRIGSQLFFAMSPVAAYLPQYLAMRRDGGGGGAVAISTPSSSGPRTIPPSSSDDALASMALGEGRGGRGGMHRRTRSRSPVGLAASILASPPPMSMSNPEGSGTPLGRGGGGAGGGGVGGEGSGMSPLSILILLLSHLLRLLYFYGQHIWLPRSRDAAGTSAHRAGKEEVQYDLVVQSVVMIAVQLFLVRGTAKIRWVRTKRLVNLHENSDAGARTDPASPPSWCDERGYRSSILALHGRGGGGDPRSGFLSSAIVALACARYSVRKGCWLLHPKRVWQYNTLSEHIQFLSLLFASIILYCRLWLFPTFFADGVDRVRNVSVLLESCLALPQAAQNYLRRDTAGLSVVMVVGWILGDFMKLVYFLIQTPVGLGGGGGTGSASEAALAAAVAGAAVPGGSSGDSSPGTAAMKVFAAGCIVALALDIFVLAQLVFWYPTRAMLAMHARVAETWNRFKPNNVSGRKRAVAKEMVRLMIAGGGDGDKAQQQ